MSTGQQRPVAEPMMLASSLGSRPSLQGDSISVRKLWEMEQFHSNLGQIHSSLEQIYARIEPPSPPKIILEDMI